MEDPLNTTKPYASTIKGVNFGGLNDTSSASLLKDFSIDLPMGMLDSNRSHLEDAEIGVGVGAHSRKKSDRNFIYIDGLDDSHDDVKGKDVMFRGSKKNKSGGKSYPRLGRKDEVLQGDHSRSPNQSDGDGDSDANFEDAINIAAADSSRIKPNVSNYNIKTLASNDPNQG